MAVRVVVLVSGLLEAPVACLVRGGTGEQKVIALIMRAGAVVDERFARELERVIAAGQAA